MVTAHAICHQVGKRIKNKSLFVFNSKKILHLPAIILFHFNNILLPVTFKFKIAGRFQKKQKIFPCHNFIMVGIHGEFKLKPCGNWTLFFRECFSEKSLVLPCLPLLFKIRCTGPDMPAPRFPYKSLVLPCLPASSPPKQKKTAPFVFTKEAVFLGGSIFTKSAFYSHSKASSPCRPYPG